MKASFFVTVRTGETSTKEDYETSVESLKRLFNAILTEEAIKVYCKGDVQSLRAEMEILIEQDELTLKAVLDIEATEKIVLDKAKLTTVLRNNEFNKWGNLKVEKRAVPQ